MKVIWSKSKAEGRNDWIHDRHAHDHSAAKIQLNEEMTKHNKQFVDYIVFSLWLQLDQRLREEMIEAMIGIHYHSAAKLTTEGRNDYRT